MKLLFRRATHDAVTGEYRKDIFYEHKQTHFMKMVWQAHGDVCHLLSSKEPLSYDDLLEQIRKDTTNYDYHPNDLKQYRDAGMLPTPERVALSLVRLIEAGFVEVVSDPLEALK